MKPECAPTKPSILAGSLKAVLSKAGPVSQDFIALPLQNLMAGQQVPFEVLLKTTTAGQEGAQFKTCCQAGQAFQPDWLAKLQEAGVTRVYFRQQDQELVWSYLNARLPAILNDDSIPIKDRAERVADATYIWMHHFFATLDIQTRQQVQQGFIYVDHLQSLINQDHYHRRWVLDLCRYDQTIYSHSLNASLLIMAFGKHLGWADRKIQELGRGGLLHDIGMTRIPIPILNKKEELTEEEWESVKKHPYSGYIMLKTLSLLQRESLLLVLQHHENGDGSGYPDGLTLAKIHPNARLMRIIDSFEAMVSPRSWRSANPPAKALWIMRQDWQDSGKYDAALLIEFIKFIAGDKQSGNPKG
jgi:HD-GYP domain-containing protein (c-di-GMP phosphodiesterase class II)